VQGKERKVLIMKSTKKKSDDTYDPRRSRFYFLDALMRGPKTLAKIQDHMASKGYGFCHSTKSCLLGADGRDDRPALDSPHIAAKDGLIEITDAGRKYHEAKKAAAKARGFAA
jgi:hypothetical protein